MTVWHAIVHGGAAAILLAIGIPFLVLSARAYGRQRWQFAIRPAGEVRSAVFGALTIVAVGALTFAVFSAARSADASGSALISTIAAALGAIVLHSVRRASFNNVATVPLAGIVAIGMLLTIAGPQAPGAHRGPDAVTPAAHSH